MAARFVAEHSSRSTMNYLLPSEYEQFGLETTTPEAWTGAASALMNAHCRRASLAVMQYVERLRVSPDRNLVHLTYLPLSAVPPATNPIVAMRGRYASSLLRRGEFQGDLAQDVVRAFSLPGTWASIDPAVVDFDANTGEVTLPSNVLALTYNEVEITYSAGLEVIPDEVKFSCAQIVKNAQATPALNVRSGQLDTMRLDYFADALVDPSVRKMLAPYVAQRMG
jgi:hypothetical protein